MPKKFSTGQWLARAIDRGLTMDQLADTLGRSKGYVQKIVSGRAPAGNLFETARDLGKGKRSITPPPPTPAQVKAARARGEKAVAELQAKSAKPVKAPVLLSALERAEAQLNSLDPGRYVIHVTSKKTGQSRTLCRKGGVNPDTILQAPDLESFLDAQGGMQGYGEIDWAEVYDIEFEEYY